MLEGDTKSLILTMVTFVIDVYSFLLQNLNPLMINRKFHNKNDRQCVKMLWQKCLPQQFTLCIFLYENFLGLTHMEITYQKANTVELM